MTRRRKLLGASVASFGLAAFVVVRGFTREYAVPAPGLLDLKATVSGGAVIVTGVLLGSGGRVTHTTATRYGDTTLVRVYATAIRDSDDPRTVRGNFAAVIPKSRAMRSVMVGERSGSVTVGHLYGFPIRIPRLPQRASVGVTVWPENEREKHRRHADRPGA